MKVIIDASESKKNSDYLAQDLIVQKFLNMTNEEIDNEIDINVININDIKELLKRMIKVSRFLFNEIVNKDINK